MVSHQKSDRLDEMRSSLDYFVAGVPALGYFELQAESLSELVASSKEERLSGLNQIAEISLIGLSAYFEAFCKAHFAALINICPKLLKNFTERRKNATVGLAHILAIGGEFSTKLGSLISEAYDFGSAKEINGLYQDLVRITPFSASEAKRYSQFLSDRNLLVHHGGVFTFAYSSQRFTRRTAPGLPHWDSLVVRKTDFNRWNSFVLELATKIATSSKSAITEFISKEKLKLNSAQKKAIGMLGSSR